MKTEDKDLLSYPLVIILAATSFLVAAQRQFLLVSPPKLREINIQQIRSGTAALNVLFSRPMKVESVRKHSKIHPEFPHQWLGNGKQLRLLLNSDRLIRQPLRLEIGGVDHRGIKLQQHDLWWDPRPYLLAVALLPDGEQLQMRRFDGSWVPLSPVFSKIRQLEPLGNGRGVAFVSIDKEWRQKVWLRGLIPSSLSSIRSHLNSPRLGHLHLLTPEPQVYALLSSNQHGELLVQVGADDPGSTRVWLQDEKGQKSNLDLKGTATGQMSLIPDGSGLVMPSSNGLELVPLLQDEIRNSSQILPGDRNLQSFCSGSGRAVVTNVLPDFQESIELLIPGMAPKQLWNGDDSIVMAASCDNQGEHILIGLRKYEARFIDEIILIDSDGNTLRRRLLTPWSLRRDSRFDYDPIGDQFLITLLHENSNVPITALIRANDLEITILDKEAEAVRWLPAAADLKVP